MKTMAQIIAEVAAAKSPADKEFVALHSTQKKQFVRYPENQFKGGTDKDHSKMARPSNATGMEDDIAAEKPVSEAKEGEPPAHRVRVVYQHKNNVVPHERTIILHANDRKDAESKARKHVEKEGHKVLRSGWSGYHQMDEETQLDEISKKTLGSYIGKAANEIGFHMYDAGSAAQRQVHSRMSRKEPESADFKAAHSNRMKAVKRLHGVEKATKRLTKEEMDSMSFEQISEHNLQEISKATLGSYIKKASLDATDLRRQSEQERQSGYEHNRDGQMHNAMALHKAADKSRAKMRSRLKGVGKAVDRLTKEDVDQLDELAKTTLKSYIKKASTSRDRAWAKADKEEDKAMSTNGDKYPEKQARHQAAANQAISTWNKRNAGIDKATGKLKK